MHLIRVSAVYLIAVRDTTTIIFYNWHRFVNQAILRQGKKRMGEGGLATPKGSNPPSNIGYFCCWEELV